MTKENDMEVRGIAVSDEQHNTMSDGEDITLLQEGMTGSVKFFNRIRGWGFVIQDSDQDDAFVNWRWILSEARFKSLDQYDWVIFDLYEAIVDGERKLQARNVRKIEDKLLD